MLTEKHLFIINQKLLFRILVSIIQGFHLSLEVIFVKHDHNLFFYKRDCVFVLKDIEAVQNRVKKKR